MGSFCISCGVSGQVIADNDQCVAIPIVQSSTYVPATLIHKGEPLQHYGIANSVCHPGAYWSPLSSMITGTYADYGCIEPADTPENRLLMVEFFTDLMRHSKKVLLGENTCHDIAVDVPEFVQTQAPAFWSRYQELKSWLSHVDPEGLPFAELQAIWEYLEEATHEHRLFVEVSGVIRPVQFAAVHQRAADYLVDYVGKLKPWRGGSYELTQYLADGLAELAKEMAAEADASFKAFRRLNFREKLRLDVSESSSRLLLPFSQRHSDLLMQHFEGQLSLDALVEALRPSMLGIYVLKGMESLDLKFGPIAYAGQDYDNSQGQAYAEFVTAVAQQVTEDRKRHYE